MNGKNGKIEILAPAGSFECLSAALRTGADSVYFGAGPLNLRSRATANFAASDIRKIVRYCRKYSARSYLALNSIIYDDDIQEMRNICDTAKQEKVSAVIAMDLAVMEYARSINLPVHVSVQTNVTNLESVRFFAKFADTIVLARELTLPQIQKISAGIISGNIRGPDGNLVRIELFIHGALCMSISGKCYLSLAAYGSSANRGDCYQNCRRTYKVTDEQTGYELQIDNKFVMSPKDLCTIRILDKILDSGVSVLKIEGRGRPPEYVAAVTSAYRKAVKLWEEGSFTLEEAAKLESELENVFNRGFWHGGYYLGGKTGEWSGISGNAVKEKKEAVGFISNFYHKINVAELTLNAGHVQKGDKLLLSGASTGMADLVLDEFKVEDEIREKASKGEIITFISGLKLRRNDKAYKVKREKT